MAQDEPNPLETAPKADLRVRFDHGIRDGAEKLTALQAAHGFAGSFTLTFLIASAFFPLLLPATAGGAAGSVAVAWLSGLGCNVLAGWLANWAERGIGKLRLEDKVQEQQLIQEFAAGLEGQLASNEALQEELAILLEQTDGIATAIASLSSQSDAQTKLIEALVGAIHQGNLIQGRLHRILVRQLGESEERIIKSISFLEEEMQLQGEKAQARLDTLPAMDTKLDAILRILTREEIRSSHSGVQDTVEAQIDIARKLVQDGHFVAARKVLIEIQAQPHENEVTPESRARIANLLGACAFARDELDQAQGYFNEAIALAPNNIGMLANGAMVALLSYAPEVALELSTRARNLDRKEANATAAYLQALHRLGRHEELEKALNDEPWITEHAVNVAALASINYERGEYQEAETLLRRAISLDASEPQMHILLANSILAPLTAKSFAFVQFDRQLNERLKAAEEALSQAVALYAQGDNQTSLHAALVSRAGIRCIQGKQTEGLADCDRVLRDDRANKGALENKGRILLNLDRTREAIACFEQILNLPVEETVKPRRYRTSFIGGRQTNTPALLASAYVDAGQITKAVELLLPLFKPSPDDRDQLDIAEVLLVAQSKQPDYAAAADTLKVIEATWPQQPEAKAVLAEYFARQRDYAQAIKLLQEAAGLSEGFLRSSFTARVAHFLYQDKRYAEAVDVLRPIVEKGQDNPDLRLLITCLYNSHQLAEALPLAHLIRSTTGAVPGVAEIEALILEKGGDIKQASQIWQQLMQVEPANMSYRVNAAYVEWRGGNREAAEQLTLSIPYETVKNNASLLINIARLRSFLKLPEVLGFAYQARRIAFHNPDIHVQYMILGLHTEAIEHPNVLLVPEEVRVDTAVHLERHGNTTTFLIVDDEIVPGHPNELHISDPLAQKLLGRRIGEHIALRDSFLGTPEYEIREIQTKYLYASHETTRLFEQGRLRHNAFDAGDITEPDFMERFARFLDQRAQLQPDIQALYTKQGIPLSTFAHIIGRSIIDIWLVFIETPGERLFSATGSLEEAEAQRQALAASTSVVVDLLSLLTLVHVSLEEVVVQRFDTILMPQALLDQLHEYEQELDGSQPRGTVGSSGGQRYFLEIPPEYYDRKREFVNKVLAFVRDKVQIHPTMGLIEAEQELVTTLGEAATASILLAKEHNLPLYSDDLRIRTVAHQHWQVSGFDTQTVLRDVRTRNLLRSASYYNALSRLAQSNYQFVRIEAEALVFILEQNGMAITEEVRSLFKLLHGPECTPDSATQVIAEVIKQIWIKSVLHRRKLFILDLALTTLFTGRRPASVIPALKVQLWQKFRLISHLLPEILDNVDYWGSQPRQ